MARTALITGISGQDGAYLARLLLDKGYRVLGSRRPGSTSTIARLAELRISSDVELVAFDLFDQLAMAHSLEQLRPDEIYNLAAQSSVSLSFKEPLYTAQLDALAPARLLEAIRTSLPTVRFYQAATSEMFGLVSDPTELLTEEHPFHPRSPYGAAKAYAHWLTVNYRESYGLFAVSGILFNHESPLRGPEFVTRKVTSQLAELKAGHRKLVSLGNLDVRRDWGYAGDYVEGMWLMLQQEVPRDFVLATGRSESLRRFVEVAAQSLGFDIVWTGEAGSERGVDKASGRTLIAVDPEYRRPSDIPALVGDPTKARKLLGWTARVGFEELVRMMTASDEARIASSSTHVIAT